MSGATAALWTLAVTVILALVRLVPKIGEAMEARAARDKAQADHDRELIELARVKARREAAFNAGFAMEANKERGLSGPEKLAGAVQLANEVLTPSTITVTPADVEAALPHVRASLATPTSSFPPPAEDRPTTPIRGRTP